MFDQSASSGADVTVYFSCVPKGRVHMPHSLRDMQERVKNSKVKLYHGQDLELEVIELQSLLNGRTTLANYN